MTDLTIIIVNRNTRQLLLDCLGSVYKTVSPLTFEITVVDNASTDGSVEALRASYPGARVIENRSNLGFARANNQAIVQARGRYIVLLNTDTVLTEGALGAIVALMDADRKVAVCGGQLLNGDGSLQNSIANIPTLASELLNKSLLRLLLPRRYPGKGARFERPTEVESIIGACMVVSKAAIEKAGLLDEEYFFFLEETDWCLSMRRLGMKVFFHPDARIYHLQGQTAKKNLAAARIEYWRSRYIFFGKHYSSLENAALTAGLVLRLCLSIVLQLLASPASSGARGRLAVNSRILLWHLAGRPADWGLQGLS